MILADTSIWIDHLRGRNNTLAELLAVDIVLIHPFVVGELALGNLRQREVILEALSDLPQATVATDKEVLHFVERYALHGRGIGFLDAHLLAAVRLTSEAVLWSRDRRLHAAAAELGFAMANPPLSA